MSTSGGNTTGYLLPPAGRTGTFGKSTNTSTAWANSSAYLMPVFIPAPFTVTRLGVQVTVVGDAGCTITPLIYADSGHGEPAGLLFAGTPVAGDAVGVNKAAAAFTIPAGWVHVGAFMLGMPATKPAMYGALASGQDRPGGGLVISSAGTVGNSFNFQSALAAPPDPWGGAPNTSICPLIAWSN